MSSKVRFNIVNLVSVKTSVKSELELSGSLLLTTMIIDISEIRY